MILDSLGSRLDITLSLTIAREVVGLLDSEFNRTLVLKGFVTMAIFLALWEKWLREDDTSVWMNMVRILRRLSVLVFVQILLDGVQPKMGRPGADLFADLERQEGREPMSLFSYIPLSVWPLVESFVMSSILIICVTFTARVVSGSGIARQGPSVQQMRNKDDKDETQIPELERLLFCVQYSFADTVALLMVDPRIQRVIAFMGFIGLKPLTDIMNRPSKSTSAVLVSGVSMAWVNLVVQLIVPDGRWSMSVHMEVVATLGLATLIQALQGSLPGIAALQGYIEWHLSNVFAGGMERVHVNEWDIIIVSAISYVTLTGINTLIANEKASDPVATIQTLRNISTLMFVNTFARAVMNFIHSHALMDSVTVIVLVIVFGKAIVHAYHELAHKV